MYHPSHPKHVLYDEHIDEGEEVPDEWMRKVSVCPTTVHPLYLPHSSCWFYDPLTKIVVSERIFQAKKEEQSGKES